MLLTIYNLPSSTRYCDLKQLIQLKCNLSEIILDNLVSDGKGNKKVTVGLAEESDAAILVRKVNGIFVGGNQLYVENVKQNKASEQPYHSSNAVQEFGIRLQDGFQKQVAYQQPLGNQDQNSMMMMAASNMGMYYMPVMPTNQTAFMNYGGPPQIPPLMSQFSEPSVKEKSEPKDRSRDWATGINDRDFDVRRRPETSWQRQDIRQSSPISDQRNSNFGRGQKVNENSGGRQPRWMQSDTTTARDDRSVRDYSWEQTNMSAPRDGTVRHEGESRWELSSVPHSRNECNRGEPNPMTSRDNRNRNGPIWEQRNVANDRDETCTRSLRSPSRSSMEPLNRYNDRSNFASKNDQYKDRKVVQGNWGAGYGQQIPTHGPKSFNSNVFGVSNQSSSMFGSHVTESAQELSESRKGHGPSRWDNSSRTSNPQEIPQQRYSLTEKNRPERVSRPTPRYEEHDISRPSKPGDGRLDRAFNKRPQSFRNVQEPPAKRLPNQPYAKPYLPNTTRRTSPSGPPRWEPPKHKQSGSQHKPNMRKLLHKDNTWRHQAASALARQTFKSLSIKGTGVPKDLVIKKLKASINSRIDVMLGEKVAMPMEEIVKIYRQRFHFKTDRAFFGAVLDSLKNDEQYRANTDKPGMTGAEDDKEASKPEEMVPDVKATTGSGKMPRYPNQDKKAYIQQKKLSKQEMLDGNMYKLEDKLLQASVDEHADVLCDLFMEACGKPDNEKDKKICEKLTDIVADDFRKIIRLHLTKRLLNITSNLALRIFTTQKVDKEKLVNFFAPFNLASFKKSERKVGLFIGICSDYDGFDKLCQLQEIQIDGVTVTIKPMHITGPPPKVMKPNKRLMVEKHDISEEPVLEQEGFSKENEESVEHDAEDIIDDYAHDGDQIEDDNDQNATGNNDEGNIQDIPDLDEANEEDLEDY